MKKYLFIMAAFFALSSFKAPKPVNETVVKTFKKSYPEAKEAKWFEKDDEYQVSFKQNGIAQIIYFNKDSRVYRLLRYYEEKNLSPFIAFKVKEKYQNKSVKGIAELTTSEGVLYEIIMEDDKSFYIVHSDDAGNVKIVNKYKKA